MHCNTMSCQYWEINEATLRYSGCELFWVTFQFTYLLLIDISQIDADDTNIFSASIMSCLASGFNRSLSITDQMKI